MMAERVTLREGEWVEVMPATLVQLERARRARAGEAMEQGLRALSAVKALEGIDLGELLAGHKPKEKNDGGDGSLDLADYDVPELVDGSVSGWSFDEKVGTPSEQLTAEDCRVVAQKVLELSLRPPE
jgi:hypothetical protein